jgi:hypothetical protein
MKKVYNLLTWSRFGGYECSSKGDKRFSAFTAKLLDGRTIEQHYQCDVKGYDVGGTNWKLGKGKPALDTTKDLYVEYLKLWKEWASYNLPLMRELYKAASRNGYVLSDRFATSDVNQARALSDVINELIGENS